MDDYEIGYRKPPTHTRFKPGICPNPSGRGKRQEKPVADMIREILNTEVSFAEDGKRKKASRAALSVKRLITSALNGNTRDAALLLKLRRHADSTDNGPLVIEISGGLPDEVR